MGHGQSRPIVIHVFTRTYFIGILGILFIAIVSSSSTETMESIVKSLALNLLTERLLLECLGKLVHGIFILIFRVNKEKGSHDFVGVRDFDESGMYDGSSIDKF